MIIRFANISDSLQLLKIYSQYIQTPVTFEYGLPTEQEFAKRIQNITKEYPYLVYEDQGKVIGYAYAHRQFDREAYQWNAELSIYLDQAYTSRGLGKKIYCALIELLKLQGVRNIYGGVTIPNEKSEKLHLSLGFHCLGVYRKTGFKCGQWHDVAWFEKEITPHNQGPSPLLTIRELPEENITAVIEKYH